MSEPGKRGFTRRRLVAGGVAGAAVVAGAGYGRYAIGDEFEQHVAGVLGTSTEAAKELLKGARERLGDEYDLMAAEFLAVTTLPIELAPSRTRRRAVRRLIPNLVSESRENLIYLGIQTPVPPAACSGLVRR